MNKENFENNINNKITKYKELYDDMIIFDEEDYLMYVFYSDIDHHDGSVAYGDFTYYYNKSILEINVWNNGSKFLYNLIYENFNKPEYLDAYLRDLDEARKRFLNLYSKKYDFVSVKRNV